MTTTQGLRHESFRAISGTTGTYNGDSFAAFLAEGATDATYNGAFLQWLQIRTSSSDGNLQNLMQLFAEQNGAYNWSSFGSFSPL